ncbi:MAG: hypothetical protein Q8T09_14600 [Candidatus Melainabacteria bacterium]|nr:hypothetical protein [Candidatus Melainabacteria bacterium]
MAMLSSLWNTLVGNNQASDKKSTKTDSVNHNHDHVRLEKRKLVATRARLEVQATNKLDLNHLRARIDSESRDYAAMRERQQTSRSRWFGERSSGIDEAALTKRLAAPTPQLSQEEFELSLNFGDIHLPDHYESQVIYVGAYDNALDAPLASGLALDCPEDVEYALQYMHQDTHQVIAMDSIDTADFSDMAADFMDIALMPPLVALSDNIPEIDELLARLQVVEALELQEEAQEAAQAGAQDPVEGEIAKCHADLHVVTPFETCLPAPINAPVPMIKRQGKGKGKKGRRARSKEAAKMKNGTRN